MFRPHISDRSDGPGVRCVCVCVCVCVNKVAKIAQ